jgi:hypothetical protein
MRPLYNHYFMWYVSELFEHILMGCCLAWDLLWDQDRFEERSMKAMKENDDLLNRTLSLAVSVVICLTVVFMICRSVWSTLWEED